MSKFATKAAANMFCQARYEAAKSNERLSSREGAAEEIGIDRTRLARIELGSTIPCSVKKDRISEKNVCRIALRTGLII